MLPLAVVLALVLLWPCGGFMPILCLFPARVSRRVGQHGQGSAAGAMAPLRMGRKLGTEADSMAGGSSGKKQGKSKKGKKGGKTAATTTAVAIGANQKEALEAPEAASVAHVANADVSISASIQEAFPQEATRAPDKDKDILRQAPANLDTNPGPIQVPKADPLKQNKLPPEVVFFGEPRKPPPIEAAQETGYHGTLLMWARHATVAPRTAMERLDTVFPKGQRHPQASTHRLDASSLNFDTILRRFIDVSDDLEASKAFISSNMDQVPSQLFLRAITGAKLEAQSAKDKDRWMALRETRRRYIVAHDQVFFPLNIEVQKAETRVMTYLARRDIENFARVWDEVEMSLHMTTLLAARLTWDERCRDILSGVREKVDNTVGYMSSGIERQLMSREFRKPGLTAEVYTNASKMITEEMPDLYAKVFPEVKLVNEAFYINNAEEVRTFVTKEFCPCNDISVDLLKERLRLYETSLASIQGVNYVNLRLVTRTLLEMLSTPEELQGLDKWFIDRRGDSWKFDTYEPDEIPTMVRIEQRMRDTGSAFKDFVVQVLKGPTYYTDAFSGKRPKASSVGDWLYDDEELMTPEPASYEERIEEFRKAYIEQTQARMDAESKLAEMVENTMDAQDKAIKRLSEPSKVVQFSDNE